MFYTVPCNQVYLSNKFAPLDQMENIPGSTRGTSIHHSSIKSTKKRVNKRSTEYQPSWLVSSKQAKRYSRSKPTIRNLVDINALEEEKLRMIKASPHLSEYQRKAVENMIKFIHMDEAECKALKLNGGANTIKLFNSKNDILNNALHILRSSNFLSLFNYHVKCPVTEECNFCLLRSCLIKINQEKGRKKIQPVEIECQKDVLRNSSAETCIAILQMATESFKELEKTVTSDWYCSICRKKLYNKCYAIKLNNGSVEKDIMSMINREIDNAAMLHSSSHSPCGNKEMQIIIPKEQSTCLFVSEVGIDVHLDFSIALGGYVWNCVGAKTINGDCYFKASNKWIKVNEDSSVVVEAHLIENVECVVYDKEDTAAMYNDDGLCYTGKDIIKLRNRTPTRAKDRHLKTEVRRKDRHLETEQRKADRHLETEQRKADRHLQTEHRVGGGVVRTC